MKAVLLLVLLVGLCSAANVTHAGFRTTITESGLEEFKDILLAVINKDFQDIKLPDQNLDEHVPILGHITLALTDITVTHLDIPTMSLTLKPPSTLAFGISQTSLVINMNYKWRRVHWPHASDHGTVTITPSQTDIGLAMELSIDSADQPQAQVLSSTATFGSFKIHFSGKVSWLYNILIDLLKKTLTKDVEKAVSSQLANLINNNLNAAFKKFPTHIELGGGKSRCNIDIGVADLSATTSFITFGDKWATTDNATGKLCPFEPALLPTNATGKSMLQLFFDDTMVNCASWVSYVNNGWDFTLTHQKFPKLPLNTTQWAVFIPPLFNKYPGLDMVIDMAAGKIMPNIVSTPEKGVMAEASFTLNSSVVDGNSTIHTHTLGLYFVFGLDITAAQVGPNATIFVNCTDMVLNITVLQSSIGPINPKPLQVLSGIIGPIVRELINNEMKNGIVLPTKGELEFVDPQVLYHSGYFSIGTAFKLNPTIFK